MCLLLNVFGGAQWKPFLVNKHQCQLCCSCLQYTGLQCNGYAGKTIGNLCIASQGRGIFTHIFRFLKKGDLTYPALCNCTVEVWTEGLGQAWAADVNRGNHPVSNHVFACPVQAGALYYCCLPVPTASVEFSLSLSLPHSVHWGFCSAGLLTRRRCHYCEKLNKIRTVFCLNIGFTKATFQCHCSCNAAPR